VARPDVYISADVEADGPIPGPYSMLSFGLCVAGRFDGELFTVADPAADTFYAELRPIAEDVVPEALAVSGLDRERLQREGEPPAEAMDRAAAWVASVAGDHRPVLVGYPLVYDWLFLHWYFERFARAGSPFGHSSGVDMTTMYVVKAGVVMSRATKRQMPSHLLSARAHPHHALDDAIEQADLFAHLFTWHGPRGPAER
jgi:hypothetical protein